MAYKIEDTHGHCPKKVKPCPPPPPPPMSDAELEALKEQLRQEILKVQDEEKRLYKAIADIEDIAKQGSDPTATQTAIMAAISQIDIPTDGIAKQGSNENATLTATQAAALNAATYGDEIKGKLGSPTSGHPSTLFAAVENIQIDDTTLAKQGTNPDTSLTIVDDKIDDFYDTFDSDIASQLRECIGDDESESESEYDNSQSEEELARLRTLQEQLDSLTTSYEELAAGGAAALNTEVETGKGLIAQAIEDKGGTAASTMSLSQLAGAIDGISAPTRMRVSAITFQNSAANELIDMGSIEYFGGTSLTFNGYGAVKIIRNFPASPNLNTCAQMFKNCTALESVSFGNLDTSQSTTFNEMFYGCSSLTTVDLSMLDSSSHNAILSNMFSNCTSLTFADLRNFKFGTNTYYVFTNSPSLTKVDLRNTDGSIMASFSAYLINQCPLITSFVNGETYDNVVENNTKVCIGLKVNCNAFQSPTTYDRASLRALINGLANLNELGISSKTLTIGTTLKNKLSADDIAVATNKNWVIS